MKYKHLFFDDYSEGAHPRILDALKRTSQKQELGYGNDSFSKEAVDLLRKHVGNPKAEIHFVSGGTQANLIVLSAFLRPHESIIAPMTGHINIHEAGAIEATGHKINGVQSIDGKLTVESIKKVLEDHPDEHTVKPRVVFISQATEVGTIYKKNELQKISAFCKENGLCLYIDGARLGSALASREADMKLADIAKYADAFYIGGTKNGALLGEAIVINNPRFKEDFRYHLKQRGALLAKGRAVGITFTELFKDGLYFDLAKHANTMAQKLTSGIKKLGCKFLVESSTNQIFPIFPNSLVEKLQREYGFYVWTKVDLKHSAIRLVTSWATPESVVTNFLSDLNAMAPSSKNLRRDIRRARKKAGRGHTLTLHEVEEKLGL